MNVLFIGGGNMGRALIGGLLAQGMARDAVGVLEIDPAARVRLQRDFGVVATGRIDEALAARFDVIVIAVKPQSMRETAGALRAVLSSQLVVSIAAGIRIADLSRWLGGYARIVRAMPNTPALVRRGITGVFAPPAVSADDRARTEAILKAVGQTLWCEREQQLDAITAVSGSGPAYLFHYLESMVAAGEALGFTPDQARQLAYATASGAIALAEQSADSPATLRAQVTSKGGTTEAALSVIEQRAVKEAYVAALAAADARAAELGDLLGRDG
jgi:pyrroline-5-carboxylate reductase